MQDQPTAQAQRGQLSTITNSQLIAMLEAAGATPAGEGEVKPC